jgi:glycosyltransferase involved in cell wall biosynthesis
LAERVKFLGHVEASERLLRAADVFLQPSREEGLSLALLEAMASGLGVVATRVSGSEDHISPGETGLLTEPGDAAGLRAAIGNLLGDAPLAPQGARLPAAMGSPNAHACRRRRDAELLLENPFNKTR